MTINKEDLKTALKSMGYAILSLLSLAGQILGSLLVGFTLCCAIVLVITNWPWITLGVCVAIVLLTWFAIELDNARVIREYDEMVDNGTHEQEV